MRFAFGLLLSVIIAVTVTAQTRPRGRELGIPFPGTTGPLNTITDVPGVAVGHVTLRTARRRGSDAGCCG